MSPIASNPATPSPFPPPRRRVLPLKTASSLRVRRSRGQECDRAPLFGLTRCDVALKYTNSFREKDGRLPMHTLAGALGEGQASSADNVGTGVTSYASCPGKPAELRRYRCCAVNRRGWRKKTDPAVLGG